jgi:hypothetical protein
VRLWTRNGYDWSGRYEHIKVFANADAAEAWFAENDPEGVALVRGYWPASVNRSLRRPP